MSPHRVVRSSREMPVDETVIGDEVGIGPTSRVPFEMPVDASLERFVCCIPA